MEDDALMQAVAAGDNQAFGALVTKYQGEVTRVAGRLLRDRESARDVAQETFLRVWRARLQYRADGKFRLYLLRIAHNACLDHLRARVPCESLDEWQEQGRDMEGSGVSGAARQAEARMLFQDVQTALSTLPHAQRVVFVLSCCEGLSYKEIAHVLECPIGTVASRKALALETLRRRLYHWNDDGIAVSASGEDRK